MDKIDSFPVRLSSLFSDKKKIKKIQLNKKYKVIPYYIENSETKFQRNSIFHYYKIMIKERENCYSNFERKFQSLLKNNKEKNIKRNLLPLLNKRSTSQSEINNDYIKPKIILPKIAINKINKNNHHIVNCNSGFNSYRNNDFKEMTELKKINIIKNFSSQNLIPSTQEFYENL